MKLKLNIHYYSAAYAVVSCLLIGCSSQKQDTAVEIMNGGFESSKIAPWEPYQLVKASASSGHTHGGTYSLAETTAEGSVYQDLRGLEPGAVYTLSAWVSASEGATSAAQFAVWDPGRNVATFSDSVKPSPQWQQVKYVFPGPAQGVARVHLSRTNGDGTIYWDDVAITKTK